MRVRGKRIDLDFVPRDDTCDKNRVHAALENLMGTGYRLRLRQVTTIPVERSGKFRLIKRDAASHSHASTVRG